MINDKTIMIIIGAISILGYIILLLLEKNREKQKSDVLVTGLVANKLTLEMVQTFLEDPKNIGEEETEMVRKAVNMTLERDGQLLDITLRELSETASYGLIQSLIPKKGDKNE
jgi:hypothetical protein